MIKAQYISGSHTHNAVCVHHKYTYRLMCIHNNLPRRVQRIRSRIRTTFSSSRADDWKLSVDMPRSDREMKTSYLWLGDGFSPPSCRARINRELLIYTLLVAVWSRANKLNAATVLITVPMCTRTPTNVQYTACIIHDIMCAPDRHWRAAGGCSVAASLHSWFVYTAPGDNEFQRREVKGAGGKNKYTIWRTVLTNTRIKE